MKLARRPTTAFSASITIHFCSTSAGFSEAAIAVNQAVHWIYPEKKVTPGHSSNMGVFGQKDD